MSLKKTLVYAWNVISIFGFILILVGGALIATFQAIEVMHEIHNPYIGILIYFIFPGIGSDRYFYHQKSNAPG
jgi:hypothetical protein